MNSPKNDTINRNIPLWQQLLSDRYILQSALKMNWTPLIYKTTEWRASGWVYFTYTLNGEIGRKRWKNSDKKNQGGDKYRYLFNKTSLPQPVYYHHPQIKSFIANANGILFLVGGEPDVLSMHTLGTYNCLSYLGENNVPSILVDNLRTLGVKKVIHLPNTDAVGIRSAQKTRDKLAGSGIIYKALQLPVKDVNDLLILLKGDIQRCLTTIHDLPLLDLPAPKLVQLSKRPASPYPLPTGSTESVIVRIKSQIALADYIGLDTELKRDGSARLAGRTPWRNERTPSLKIYLADQSWYDFGEGTGGDIFSYVMKRDDCNFMTALRTLSAKLGIEFPPPKRQFNINIIDLTRAPGDSPFFFSYGPPNDLRKRYLSLHELGNFADHGPAALVDDLLHEAYFAGSQWVDKLFTLSQLERFTRSAKRETHLSTLRRGVEQLVALSRLEKKGKLPIGKAGNRPDLYCLIPITVFLQELQNKLIFRAKERAFGRFIPATADKSWFIDDPEPVARLLAEVVNHASGELYEQRVAEIRAAEAEYHHNAENILRTLFLVNEARERNIREFDLTSTPLEKGVPWKNASDYRDSFLKATLNSEEPQYNRQRAAQLGISPKTLAKKRKKLGIIVTKCYRGVAEIVVPKKVHNQVERAASWAYDRRLVSSSGKILTISQGTYNAYLDHWTTNEIKQESSIILEVYNGVTECPGTPEELEKLNQKIPYKYQRRRYFQNGRLLPEAEPVEVKDTRPSAIEETFPKAFTKTWIEDQLDLRNSYLRELLGTIRTHVTELVTNFPTNTEYAQKVLEYEMEILKSIPTMLKELENTRTQPGQVHQKDPPDWADTA